MKCMSCQEEVSPRCKKAIELNQCPFCGDPIMDERLKSQLSVLLAVMTDLHANFKDELDDWLDKNFQYVDLALVKSGAVKKKIPEGASQTVSDEDVAEFQQRAKKMIGKKEASGDTAQSIVEQLRAGKSPAVLKREAAMTKVDLDDEEGFEVQGEPEAFNPLDGEEEELSAIIARANLGKMQPQNVGVTVSATNPTSIGAAGLEAYYASKKAQEKERAAMTKTGNTGGFSRSRKS
jgi:hypothetical protein